MNNPETCRQHCVQDTDRRQSKHKTQHRN